MLPKMLKFFTNNLRHFDMKFIMASSMHKILVSLVVPFFAQQTFAKSIYALVESFGNEKAHILIKNQRTSVELHQQFLRFKLFPGNMKTLFWEFVATLMTTDPNEIERAV